MIIVIAILLLILVLSIPAAADILGSLIVGAAHLALLALGVFGLMMLWAALQ